MFGIMDALKMGAAALAAGVIAYASGHYVGENQGRALERADSLARSMQFIKERSETNVEIGRMDDSTICSELGGVWVLRDQGGVCE